MAESDLTIRTTAWPGLLLERYMYRPGPPSDYPPHVHETYQLGIALGRAGEYRFRRATHAVPSRAVIVIHPDERHAVRDSDYRHEPTSYLMLYVDPDIVRSIAAERTGRSIEPPPFFADPVFDDDIVRTYVSLFADVASQLDRETRLVSLLGTLAERHADDRRPPREPARSRAALLRVRDFLRDTTTADIPLQHLADLAGMSRFHLVRQFKQAFGVPPHTYHLHARIDHARRLLAAGETGSSVALKTGFYDQSHFGRHFRRLVGVPPSRYRPEQ